MTTTNYTALTSPLFDLFSNRPLLQVEQTVTQSPANSTFTTVTYTTIIGDTHSGWNGTNSYTVKVAGWYHLSMAVDWAANATGIRAAVFLNNAAFDTTMITNNVPNSGVVSSMVYGQAKLAVNDVITSQIDQTSGGALATQASGGFNSFLALHWISS